MIKPIVKDPFFLGQKSEEATKADLYLVQDLQDTLGAHKEHCVGMANLVMFNPLILSKALSFDTKESCLSLTGERPTVRYQKIEIAFYDQHWQERKLSLEGLPAQICQHELDHLEGVVI